MSDRYKVKNGQILDGSCGTTGHTMFLEDVVKIMNGTIEAKQTIQDVANKVCGHLPEGKVITLSMENGSAWVMLDTLHIDGGGATIEEQINEALCTANGFSE